MLDSQIETAIGTSKKKEQTSSAKPTSIPFRKSNIRIDPQRGLKTIHHRSRSQLITRLIDGGKPRYSPDDVTQRLQLAQSILAFDFNAIGKGNKDNTFSGLNHWAVSYTHLTLPTTPYV